MNTWVQGLLAAAIGGGANAITLVIVDPSTFNLTTGFGHLVTVTATSALLAVAMFLKQSPLPSTPAKP